MAQLFETLCMMLAFKESHSLAMHYCRLVWDVRSLSKIIVIISYISVFGQLRILLPFARTSIYRDEGALT